MKCSPFALSLLTASLLAAALPIAALAETPYEVDQRQQLEKYQREHGLSPAVQQAQRWEQEWRAQHPGEPVPNAGVLQKLHREEILANMNAGFARMRAQRQADLQHEYQMVRQNQAQQLARQGITWTPQQWQQWDRQYDQAQQQRAQDYLRGVEQAGEMARAERAREEQERLWKPVR